MFSQIRASLASLLMLTLITGVLYPLLITGIAQAVFPHQANGSLVEKDGRIVGSTLIGQPFDDPRYFWSRLSATSAIPYDAGASSGSNLGPLNPALGEAVKSRLAALHAADPAASRGTLGVPVDLVTASASGLDPHISLAAAAYQVARVANARGVSESAVRELVTRHTRGRTLGLLGEPVVNVLELNLDLDSLAAGSTPR
ncbi:MAG: potassium-transporting ATPase subunit KdpC [Phycisphaeraceae bacterium]|nr:potassium-transporting ATPase subunit KdpC [Phycisphaeraceae bacterium]